MGKKVNALSYLYLIGMVVAVIGFCCPMFKAGPLEMSGLKFINFDNFGFSTIGALLLLCGAAVGVVWSLLPLIGIKLPAADLIKWIAIIACIAGAIVLFLGFNDSWIGKKIGKGILKHSTYGFWMYVVGVLAALFGKFQK